MDKVTFLGGHPPPPPPPTSSPPRPSSADQKTSFPKKEQPHDPEEEEDAEVMQVVGNGPAVCLRTKKQRIVNGAAEDVERPMSWEGELSDDDDEIVMDPKRAATTPPPPPHITGRHIMPTVISTTTLPARPLGSPMCMDDESHVSSITRIKVSILTY